MRYDPALDGLRAVAVGGVVTAHAFPGLQGGWIGVDLFFVISGFLITTILREEIEQTGRLSFRSFYIRRALRLFPALLAFLACALALAAARGNALNNALPAAAFAVTYTMNWNYAFGWVNPWALAHTWSLAAEEQFYLLWPVTFLLIFRRNPAIFVVLILSILITWRSFLVYHGADPLRLYSGFDTHSDGLLIGCFLALRPMNYIIRQNLRFITLIAMILIAWLWVDVDYKDPLTPIIGIPLASAASAVLLLAARNSGILRSFLLLGPIRYIGRISYGIYLWHVLGATTGAILNPIWGPPLGVLASIGVAALSFHFLEQPLLAHKDRWAPRGGRHIGMDQLAPMEAQN